MEIKEITQILDAGKIENKLTNNGKVVYLKTDQTYYIRPTETGVTLKAKIDGKWKGEKLDEKSFKKKISELSKPPKTIKNNSRM